MSDPHDAPESTAASEAATQAILRELAMEYADLNSNFFSNHLRPIPLQLREGMSLLGCFVPDPRRIELARALVMQQPWGTVIEVLKHEMAHQFMAEVWHADEETSHGPRFQRLCEQLGIDARASGMPEAGTTQSPILDRIRKLFALAGSSNQHEAEAAMRMAHRLMLKHNVERPSNNDDAGAYGFRHLGRYTGRISEAENVLAGLLGEFFFVQPIWVSVYRVQDGKRVSVLEVTGRHENLAMADYVYGFLQSASEALWREHKDKHGISGDSERRVFMAGVMRGFAEKLRTERTAAAATGLVWVADPLAQRYFRRRHPRVRSSVRTSSEHRAAAAHGRAAGRELVLNRPMGQGPSKKVKLLPG
jgi:hypothetical protein